MSTAHHTDSIFRPGMETVHAVMSDPRVAPIIAVRPRINKTYDIPYVGGYSKDGKVVFIDRHLPANIRIEGKNVNPLPFIVTHEHTEKTLMDVLGMSYHDAHTFAEVVEEEHVRRVCSPMLYEQALVPYIKADEIEKIVRFPADCDLAPYIQSNDIKVLMRIRMVLNKSNWASSIAGHEKDS